MTKYKKAEWNGYENECDDGPAEEWADGKKAWWVDDKQYKTKVTYEEALKIWKMNEAMK